MKKVRMEKHFNLIKPSSKQNLNDELRLSTENDFLEWRQSYAADQYYYFTFEESNKIITFSLKLSRRKKYLKELTIGDIRTNSNEKQFLLKAFDRLKEKALQTHCVTFLSCAINESSKINLTEILKAKGFKPFENKKIYFILKPFVNIPELAQAKNWILYRSDIDTW